MPIWVGVVIGFVMLIAGIFVTSLGASSKIGHLDNQILDLQDQLNAKNLLIKKYCVCNFMPKED